MFRRKRFSEPAASIPWWPTEDPGRCEGNAAGHGGPGGYGPAGAPPLAAHDPFGGWPAFGDGYSDGYADRGASVDGMSGQAPPPSWMSGQGDPSSWTSGKGHPSNGWPLVEGYAAPRPPGAVHPGTVHPGTVHRGAVHPGTVRPGAPIDAGMPGADQSEGVPEWIPLLTHPIGGQRFQPDLEAASDPTGRPAAGRPPRRRNGRRPKARRQQGGPVDDPGPSASVTTWIPTIDASTPGPARGSSPDAGPAAARSSAPSASSRPVPTPAPLAAPDPAEASSLAGAFAADYLSWDQDNPARRGRVLAHYLPADVTGDPSLLGWSGKGRQRSEFSLPGAVHPDGDGRVLVDVRVRVTPFRKVGPADSVPAPAQETRLEVAGVPAVAPAPSARGWKSQDSHWVRLTVPVTRDQGRLVVDTWDEQLGADSGASDEAALGDEVDPRDTDDPGTADDADDADGPTSEQEDR